MLCYLWVAIPPGLSVSLVLGIHKKFTDSMLTITLFNTAEKDLGKTHFTIFSNLTLNIHVSPEKFQNKRSCSQFQRYNAYVYYSSYIRILVYSDPDVTEISHKNAVQKKLVQPTPPLASVLKSE
jgi:hypothetical protein